MFVELHILQNFAPSCLNRDDTNSPKTCTFGGHRRARISSQCLKRAARRHPVFEEIVAGRTGQRTKHAASELTKRLVEAGHPQVDSILVSEAFLVAAGFGVTAKVAEGEDLSEAIGSTSVLLYLSKFELDSWAQLASAHFDSLRAAVDSKSLSDKGGKTRKLKVDSKKLDKTLAKALKELPKATKAADVGLFGRMVAENKNMGIDASCQVAHAISTHAVETEMDFFTAVDDLNPKEDTGAGMMGMVEFNSACFYRYSLIDIGQLRENLGGDEELVRATVLGYARATVEAIPSGKQNSMAAHNPPEYVRVVLRSSGPPWSLANAFQKPVSTRGAREGLMQLSVQELESHHAALVSMYSRGDEERSWVATTAKVENQPKTSLPAIWEQLEEALA